MNHISRLEADFSAEKLLNATGNFFIDRFGDLFLKFGIICRLLRRYARALGVVGVVKPNFIRRNRARIDFIDVRARNKDPVYIETR